MAQQSDQDALPLSQSYPQYNNWPFHLSDESSLEPSFLLSTQVQDLDAEFVGYQSNRPERLSALTDENIPSPVHWPLAMQQWSQCSLNQGAGYAYAMHGSLGSPYNNSPSESTGFYINSGASYTPATMQGVLPHWRFRPTPLDTSIAVDLANLDPESFDFNENLRTTSSDASLGQAPRTSLRHSSVAASSPRRHVHRLSPYAATQCGRSFSDGAAVTLDRAQESASLLNNITSTPAPAFQRSNAYATGRRASTFCQRCSASMIDVDADLELSLRNLASASSSRPLTPPRNDYSPSEPPSPEPPPLMRMSLPSVSSCPPNLFSDLMYPPLSPPTQSTSATSLKPHHQGSRFPGDIYTPIYTRNEGRLREGWCGFCRPGRWLVLKNSAFWYDKCFGHGISAATGAKFEEPKETRPTRGKGGDVDGWEGRCGTCGEWVVLAGGKRNGVPWFRHAYKCHTYARVPRTPEVKRRTAPTRASKRAKGIMASSPNSQGANGG